MGEKLNRKTFGEKSHFLGIVFIDLLLRYDIYTKMLYVLRFALKDDSL